MKRAALTSGQIGKRAMNHSLLSADRTTHLKIAAVALLGVLVVVATGIAARLTAAPAAPAAGVIKAGQPTLYSSLHDAAIR
jgi:heme A synthase